MSAEKQARDAIRDRLIAEDAAKLERRVDQIIADNRAATAAEEAAALKREERRQRRAQRTAGVKKLHKLIAGFQGEIIEPGAKLLAEIEAAAAEVAAFTEPEHMGSTTQWIERAMCELGPSLVHAWRGFSGVSLVAPLMQIQPPWNQPTRWPDRVERDPVRDDEPGEVPTEIFPEAGAA